MTRSDLEKAMLEINQKLDSGINVYVKGHRFGETIVMSFISGTAFMIGGMMVQEIRNKHIRRKNKKWFEANKER